MTERAARHGFFAFIMVVIVAIYSVVDVYNLLDECLTMYWLGLGISAICGTLYLWWWLKAKRGRASEVYVWVTLLFYSAVIRLTLNIVARLDYLASAPLDYGLISRGSYAWTLRNSPELVVFSYMLALILGRLWCNVPKHECYDNK